MDTCLAGWDGVVAPVPVPRARRADTPVHRYYTLVGLIAVGGFVGRVWAWSWIAGWGVVVRGWCGCCRTYKDT